MTLKEKRFKQWDEYLGVSVSDGYNFDNEDDMITSPFYDNNTLEEEADVIKSQQGYAKEYFESVATELEDKAVDQLINKERGK